MLGVSGGLLGSSGDGAAATAAGPAHESSSGGGDGEVGGGGGVGSNSGVFGEEEKGRIIEDGDRNSAGNRWPRQETMALLKIRSDMDVAFRDSSLKGPLWEEVSRKLAELGYQRSAKKCKEKFENVYKYHKRTKDGRATKPDGKTYRFFDQLQALEHHPPPPLQPPSRPQTQLPPPSTMPASTNNPPPPLSHLTVLSTTNPIPIAATPITISHNISTLPPPLHPQLQPSTNPTNPSIPSSLSNASERTGPVSNSTSSSSTSTSSDQELFEEGRRKRKRKWKDFFEKLMKDVIQKQEELQKKFLDTIEKREHDRMVREEAWKMQEMARMNREHEILVHERSMAAAKDAAVMAFLQKISDQHSTVPVQLNSNPSSTPVPPQPPPAHSHLHSHQQLPHQQQQPVQIPSTATTVPLSLPPPPPRPQTKGLDIQKLDNGKNLNSNSNSLPSTSSSRWPKAEVQALIQLRTNLDIKYQDNGPKGPLWEEISAELRKLGYNRNAKRCKEKWENINKYFKKVKESNKQRPEDSKTCPYFHLLDALYREKNKNSINSDNTTTTFINPSYGNLKPENNPMVPLMVEPEQQWPLHPPDINNVNQNKKEDDNDEEDDEDDDQEEEDGDDDDEEDEGGGFEIVSNKASSMGTVE